MSKLVLLSMGGLAISATTAFADVSFSPSATFGVKSTDAGTTWAPDASLKLGVSGSVETDGLTYGGAFDLETGNIADADGSSSSVGSIKNPSVFVRGDFGELYAKEDDDDGLFGYKNTFGDTSVGLEHNWTDDVTKLTLGHSFGDMSVNAELNTNDEWNVKLGFDNGQFNGSVKVDQDEVVTATAGLSSNGFSLSGEFNTNDEWTISTGYTFDKLSANVSYEHDDDYSVGFNYGVNDNLSIYLEAKVEDAADQEIKFGASYSF
jgi:hypothetical protein